MKRARNFLFAILFTTFGSSTVLAVVIAMNEFAEAPPKNDVGEATAIEMAPTPKPKPKQHVSKPKPKPRKAKPAPPAPSLAAIAGGLSGIAVNIPSLDVASLGGGTNELLDTDEEVTHTGETVDDPPKPRGRRAPEYPSRLREKGVEGYVVLSIVVTKAGDVEDAKVLESKPPGAFDDVALENIRSWQFDPAQYQGQPVRVRVRQKIQFDLRRT
ncbi:MAG: energy transducer TonB [Deltaproteobacteria bacterium]|jgi:protein TonB